MTSLKKVSLQQSTTSLRTEAGLPSQEPEFMPEVRDAKHHPLPLALPVSFCFAPLPLALPFAPVGFNLADWPLG